ncbi:NUDIX domain-containing protein [Exiguobacterium oxidotolerans]|uniref:DNA mismatch repair protein MutT n=1 Tax=Exiguobacterium oxidotolerans TaxID=223958 RepID=A0A653IGG8_9BACL|nr:NUDIX hydrolase [Exiguobacterium oxidotolerans]VWX37717.1 DNA mismatch repair protein MutT [Exiguobacterium oxidotolerans]
MTVRKNIVYNVLFNETRDQLLMVKNIGPSYSYYTLPGGTVEAGETLPEAAIREAKEETGFDVEVGDLLHVSEAFFPQVDEHCLFFFFTSEIVGGAIGTVFPDEIEEITWVSIPDAVRYMQLEPEYEHILTKQQTVPYIFNGQITH